MPIFSGKRAGSLWNELCQGGTGRLLRYGRESGTDNQGWFCTAAQREGWFESMAKAIGVTNGQSAGSDGARRLSTRLIPDSAPLPQFKTAQEGRRYLEKNNVSFVLAQFVDIHGVAKTKAVPTAHFEDILNDGAGFAGFALWGFGMQPHD